MTLTQRRNRCSPRGNDGSTHQPAAGSLLSCLGELPSVARSPGAFTTANLPPVCAAVCEHLVRQRRQRPTYDLIIAEIPEEPNLDHAPRTLRRRLCRQAVDPTLIAGHNRVRRSVARRA